MTSALSMALTPAARRKAIIFAALLFSLWASWYVSQEPAPEAPLLVERATVSRDSQTLRAKAKSENSPLPERLEWPQREERYETVPDIFSPPAPVIPKASPETTLPPLAPVLKYRYIGRLEGGYNDSVFLADDTQRVTTAVAGQSLNDGWKLLSVDAQKLVFLHTPTGSQNTMIIGSM